MSDVSGGAIAPTLALPIAGWYPDPAGSDQLRWWSGAAWTDHLQARPKPEPLPAPAPLPVPMPMIPAPSPGPIAKLDGYVPMSRAVAAPLAAPAPIDDHKINAIVWPLTIIPIISMLISWATLAMGVSSTASFGMSVGIFAGCLAVATLDHRDLARRGLKPPGIGWMILLTPIAYLIARRISLKRQGIISNAPGNFYVVNLVAAVAISFIFVVPLALAQENSKIVGALEAQVAQDLSSRTTTTWLVDCPDNAPLSTANSTFMCSASDTTGLAADVTVTVDASLQVTYRASQSLVSST